MEIPKNTPLADIDGFNSRSAARLAKQGYEVLEDLEGVFFPGLYEFLSFDQAKTVLKAALKAGVSVDYSRPNWDEAQWSEFTHQIVAEGIVTWREIAMAVCGELNPPQVGTAIASNKSFQAKFPPRQTMRNVMEWFYAQEGKCASCGTRLFLEADHMKSKQEFLEEGSDPTDADTLDNLQLLCKRCNVIKRPSHDLGGISFAPAQSVLIWILLSIRPKTKADFYGLCRSHGLTMANIRFDEGWAFAKWLANEGLYEIKAG